MNSCLKLKINNPASAAAVSFSSYPPDRCSADPRTSDSRVTDGWHCRSGFVNSWALHLRIPVILPGYAGTAPALPLFTDPLLQFPQAQRRHHQFAGVVQSHGAGLILSSCRPRPSLVPAARPGGLQSFPRHAIPSLFLAICAFAQVHFLTIHSRQRSLAACKPA